MCPHCRNVISVADAAPGDRKLCLTCGLSFILAEPTTPLDQYPYGVATGVALKPAPRRLNALILVACILSLLGMALPWLSWPKETPAETKKTTGAYVSGFQFPAAMVALNEAQLRRLEGAGGRVTPGDISSHKHRMRGQWSFFAILLIPLLALLTLADELRSARTGRNHWHVRLLNSLSPIAAILIIFFVHAAVFAGMSDRPQTSRSSGEGTPFDWIGPGFWVVLIAMIPGFISIFTSPRPERATKE
jgi:hypothetical protein